MNTQTLKFTIFCISNIAERLQISARDVFELISEGVADVHCMSDAYLVDELCIEYRIA